MCTAIAKKGKDLIYGFNLDIDPAQWNIAVCKTKNYFSVGITVGRTKYLTHGVNKDGCFGNVPYMNGEPFPVAKGQRRERIDLITDRYIRGRYSYEDIEEILRTKTVVNTPFVTMHSLIGNGQGDFLILEPGYGYQKVENDYAVLSNFPVLADLTDYSNPFYGKDRYDQAREILRNSGTDFWPEDALALLEQVRQEGTWGTKVSFVYSRNENRVYYCLNGDFSRVMIHRLGESASGR